jgi:hypothetical protein
LDFGYTDPRGAASVDFMWLSGVPDPGLLALQRGALLAERGVSIAAAGTAIVMVEHSLGWVRCRWRYRTLGRGVEKRTYEGSGYITTDGI